MTVDEAKKLRTGDRVHWSGVQGINGEVLNFSPLIVSIRWDDDVEGDFPLDATIDAANRWALVKRGEA